MDIPTDRHLKLFRKWTRITLLFVFLVICAGAIVRATGSGMGCPDWPKCFGSWIPPTHVSDLPADYKEKYATHKIQVDEFNVYKTWTEYLNRLCGALLGVVTLITLLISFKIRKKHPELLWLTLLILLLIGFEGWLGKTVVDSNLSPLKITIHMVTALVIMCLCLYTLYRASPQLKEEPSLGKLKIWTILVLILSLIQIILGTQVREEVDVISNSPILIPKSGWAEMLSANFLVHRSFSILVAVLNVLVWMKLRKTALGRMAMLTLVVVLLEIIVGLIMYNGNFPTWSQPVHLVLAIVLFGTQGWIFVRLLPKKIYLGKT